MPALRRRRRTVGQVYAGTPAALGGAGIVHRGEPADRHRAAVRRGGAAGRAAVADRQLHPGPDQQTRWSGCFRPAACWWSRRRPRTAGRRDKPATQWNGERYEAMTNFRSEDMPGKISHAVDSPQQPESQDKAADETQAESQQETQPESQTESTPEPKADDEEEEEPEPATSAARSRTGPPPRYCAGSATTRSALRRRSTRRRPTTRPAAG